MPLRICLGTEPDIPADRAYLLVGDCALTDGEETKCIAGCPLVREDIHQRLTAFFKSG
jgi:hypothetical protein